jgi:hypothetical protein
MRATSEPVQPNAPTPAAAAIAHSRRFASAFFIIKNGGAKGAGLWEVRSTLATKREARVLFGFHEGILIGLHAFIKKTQKTAPSDLALARQRFKEMSS